METLKVRWTGIRPLLMHSARLADPLNSFTREIKAISSKKKKTDADQVDIANLEWRGGLYFDEADGPIIPSDNIERCIQQGAQKQRRGKDIASAVLMSEPHAKLEYSGPRTVAKLLADPKFTLRRSVKVQTARVFRVRPLFPTGWAVEFSLEYDETIIGREDLIRAMNDAGSLVGLGDWRPKFGRFTCEILS